MPIKKVIVVGAGRWSNKMHLPAILPLAQKNLIEICGVCDLNLIEAKLFAEKVNCKNISANFDELVSQFKPDGVILLVTPAAMPNLIKSCINYKLPFICEKPPATDAKIHRQLMEMLVYLQ